MRLKAIELAGFKSFVDPTRIELGHGITAIVGPNGCGKSNLVDAIRWVLGEHSARHLRGGVMDDLIFQGSEQRAPVAVCDVELTFEVEPGSLPSPYDELDEIRIRRRLTREGGSDAFINGKMVRIKDVVDLFLDTGVSTRAYAIVEQGAIARMVTARPEERRQIFEEAAGVMKYRARRREAERRMKDTRQNLDRILDLLDEVRRQCRSLKQQASRAERFKQMQQEHERLLADRLAAQYRSMLAQSGQIDERLSEAEQEERSRQQRLVACEQAVHKLRKRWIEHESRAQAVQDQLRRAEMQRAELQRKAERLAAERRVLGERRRGCKERMDQAQRRMEGLQSEIRALERELAAQSDAELLERRRQADEALQRIRQRYAEAQQRHRHLLGEFERVRHAVEMARQQRSRAQQSLQRLQARMEQLRQRRQETDREHQACKLEMERMEAQLRASRCELDAMEEKKLRLETALARQTEELQGRRRKVRDLEQHLRRLQGQIGELSARLEQSDVPSELRERLRALGGTWVDEALEVPQGLEAAVAAALRGRAADVVIPLAGDREWLQELSDAPLAIFDAGRACPETGRRASLADALKLAPDHPLYHLFAQTTLVEDIRHASGEDGVCVSLDGWRYEPGGWLVPPAKGLTARRLAMQRQLRSLNAAHEQACRALKKEEEALSRCEREEMKLRQSLESLRRDKLEAEHQARNAEAGMQRLNKQLSACGQRMEQIREDERETARELEHWRGQVDVREGESAEELERARLALEQQQQGLTDTEQALHEAQARFAEADQALALFQQSRASRQRHLDRLQDELAGLGRQLKRDRQELGRIEETLTALQEDEGMDDRLREADRLVEEAHKALHALRHEGHDLQQEQHACEQRERACRKELQDCNERRQKIELEKAEVQARLEDLRSSIVQRLRMAPEALLERTQDAEQDLAMLEARCRELEERLGRFGPVNLLAIEEYDQASQRERFLKEQAQDLESSLETLTDTIARIDQTMRERFREVFEQTNALFQQTFPRLFGGGRAELRLDSEDILNAGVEVIAQPPGKRLQDIGLLSGGEKALTAVALVFSIFQFKPAPFCILDEVDAPLDDANVGRFGAMIRELADRVQFLTITHNKITMQHADRLVGVSMPEAGVSRIVAVEVGEATH